MNTYQELKHKNNQLLQAARDRGLEYTIIKDDEFYLAVMGDEESGFVVYDETPAEAVNSLYQYFIEQGHFLTIKQNDI